jgi:hypothetical protein
VRGGQYDDDPESRLQSIFLTREKDDGLKILKYFLLSPLSRFQRGTDTKNVSPRAGRIRVFLRAGCILEVCYRVAQRDS